MPPNEEEVPVSDMRCPNCGESWMLLEDAMVVLGSNGDIADWWGELQCSKCALTCGLEQLVTGPALRLVQ